MARLLPNSARGFLLVSASVLATACLVSFDGYEPLGSAGASGSDSMGGDSASGKPSGGSKPSGGRAGSDSGGSSPIEGGDGPVGMAGEAGSDVGGSASGAGGSVAGGPMGGSAGAAMAGSAGATMGGSSGAGNGGGGNGGNGGSGGSEPKSCPVNLEGPPLIEIPKPGGGFYCMDRTEITNEQYADFLATSPGTAGQGTACTWNDSYSPDTSDTCATGTGKYDPVARPKVPVGCIDWCDAKRYCAWTGKRLCGAIGGGANPPASFADASASQWYRACSKAGTQKLPYGNQFTGNYCNGADVSGAHPDEVASHPNCVGGYSGLFDLSGNVAEWEDSCSASTGASDNCLVRGGNIDNFEVLTQSSTGTLLCNSSTPDDDTPSPATVKRNAKNEAIGFRCCLDP